MKRFWICLCILIALLLIVGCAKKQVSKPPEDAAKSETPLLADKDKKTAPDTDTAKLPKETISERALDKASQDDSRRALEELQAGLKDIYFDYDRYDIRDDAKPVLRDLASLLARNRSLRVVIEGHCDDRGTNEYNLALGDRRARAVKDFLVSLGTPSDKIDTVSYGEEKPLCTDQNEACWAKNRRAHFVLLKEAQ